MATSAFTKYYNWVALLSTGGINLAAAGATIYAVITNTAPTLTHTTLSQISELSTAGGYTAGGIDIQNDCTSSTGTATMTAVDCVWTGSGSGFTGRYFVLVSGTGGSAPLLGYYDYGSSQLTGAGETMTLDFGASVLTIT